MDIRNEKLLCFLHAQIKTLALVSCSLSTEALRKIVGPVSGKCSSVTELRLYSSTITGEERIQNNLQKIQIANSLTLADPEKCRALANIFNGFRTCTHIAIQGCGLTDRGLEIILSRAVKLTMLQLQSNALTDDCDKFLAQCKLTHLNLQNNRQITIGILQILQEIRTLQLLSLRQTCVISKDIERYKFPFKIIADSQCSAPLYRFIQPDVERQPQYTPPVSRSAQASPDNQSSAKRVSPSVCTCFACAMWRQMMDNLNRISASKNLE